MKNILYSLSIIFFLTACTSQSLITFNPEQLSIKSSKIYTHDSCANYSYISNIINDEYGPLFIENINLDNNCNWNGLSRGFFEQQFKSTLKLKSFTVIERIDYENYEFSTLLIDDKYYMNLIYKFSVNEDLFIIDYKGSLTSKLRKQFDKNYKNIYINEKRFTSNYSKSLVNMNVINAYFSREHQKIELN